MTGKCELCGVETDLTKHHLVPQSVSRSGKYPKSLKTDEGNFLMVCNECHGQIHALFSNQQLRDLYYTKELLLGSDGFGKFVMWRRKHPEFTGSSKMASGRRGRR